MNAVRTTSAPVLPTMAELGSDLLHVGRLRKVLSLSLPFLWSVAYFVFASWDWWPAAVLALVALSFVTYGSVSHDLVHRNLGLPRRVEDVLLCVIELLALRSGHAYRAAHLHHHARFPHHDDIESAASRKSLKGALGEGILFQPRIWIWAVRNARRDRAWIVAEGIVTGLLVVLAAASSRFTPVFVAYVILMIMGSWIIPVVTSWVPHDPTATDVLHQTRVFRGVVASVVALEHLYHLEHHLYPSVPGRNWPAGLIPILRLRE